MLMFFLFSELVALVMLIVILLYDLFGQRLLFSKDVQNQFRESKLEHERQEKEAKGILVPTIPPQNHSESPPPSEFRQMPIAGSEIKKP